MCVQDVCNRAFLCLRLSEGEEVLKSRVLLLQLMQNCFPMLPNPLEVRGQEGSKKPNEGAAACTSTSSCAEPLSDSLRAVSELYTHLCQSKSLPASFTPFGKENDMDYNFNLIKFTSKLSLLLSDILFKKKKVSKSV